MDIIDCIPCTIPLHSLLISIWRTFCRLQILKVDKNISVVRPVIISLSGQIRGTFSPSQARTIEAAWYWGRLEESDFVVWSGVFFVRCLFISLIYFCFCQGEKNPVKIWVFMLRNLQILVLKGQDCSLSRSWERGVILPIRTSIQE